MSSVIMSSGVAIYVPRLMTLSAGETRKRETKNKVRMAWLILGRNKDEIHSSKLPA